MEPHRDQHPRATGEVRPAGRRRGGALVQALVVLAIVGVALGVLLPVVARARRAAGTTQCLSNLREVSIAFRMYAADNRGELPYPALTQVPWERSLAARAGDRAFVCPGDQELAPATGSSYDWRDTGVPATTLAGRDPAYARPDAVLAFDALPGWHARGRMNVVRVDGSAESLDAAACVLDLQRPARPPP